MRQLPQLPPRQNWAQKDLHPTKSGWHLIRYPDDIVAIVRYDGGRWKFGSTQIPTTHPTGMSYLGGNVGAMSVSLPRYIKNLPRLEQEAIISQIDTGQLGRGQPLVIGPAGKLQPGTKHGLGSATPANIIPSPSIHTGGGIFGAIAAAINGIVDFLKFISWIFFPLNLLRAVEFLAGIGTMAYGVSTLLHTMRRNSATHRTTLGTVFGWTPWGRELQFAKARRRGKRAGQTQAERDVAYRGARQERARQVGAGRRTTPGSGTGGTGEGSSALE